MKRSGSRASFPILLVLAATIGFSQGQNVNSTTDKLKIVYEWKYMDYQWPNDRMKHFFPNYKIENNIAFAMEVTEDRIFITMPRLKNGTLATVNYFYRNDTSRSPLLHPYPSWGSNIRTPIGDIPEIVSALRIRADNCDRLWVLDAGITDILGKHQPQVPPALLIYNLRNDHLIRKFVIPENQRTNNSFFVDLVVEDRTCNDTFAFLGDTAQSAIVLYSWKHDNSSIVRHQLFQSEQKADEFRGIGLDYDWRNNGLLGMSLAPTQNGSTILYFHPVASARLFFISTKILRYRHVNIQINKIQEFEILVDFEPAGECGSSFFDTKSGVMFYSLLNRNAIVCWRPEVPYDNSKRDIVYSNDSVIDYPNDIKIDADSNIWILSDKLSTYLHGSLNPEDYNFRILTATTEDLVRDTACDKISNSTYDNSLEWYEFSIGSNFQNDTKGEAGQTVKATSSLLLILSVFFTVTFYEL